MKVLFVASECAPFVKTGGLADVIGAVPKTLADMDVEVRILLPAYPALARIAGGGQEVWSKEDLFGGPARLIAAEAEGLSLLLLEAAHLYDRAGNIYLGPDGQDWSDNHLRFGALSWVGAEIAKGAAGGWQPDLVNAHDWQAGLVPAYLSQTTARTPPVVLTIHNIAFQGLYEPSLMAVLRLSPALFTADGIEYYGKLGFLKAGIAFSQKITTVSPTYAAELMTHEFGMGLQGLLAKRSADLSGILNGIDLDVWNPATDPHLAQTYDAKSLKAKRANRPALADRFGLDLADDAPLYCVISRLTSQKGLDLLLEVVPGLVERGGRLAVLGSGEPWLEEGFQTAAKRHPGRVGCVTGYDEPLSHQMVGGSDAILVPSRFEPCGLTQLYGLRYGTLPVVARTGGLADTVIDANPAGLAAGCATGFQFAPVTAQALDLALARAQACYAASAVWTSMVKRAMAHPVGWDQSAHAYKTLYESLLA